MLLNTRKERNELALLSRGNAIAGGVVEMMVGATALGAYAYHVLAGGPEMPPGFNYGIPIIANWFLMDGITSALTAERPFNLSFSMLEKLSGEKTPIRKSSDIKKAFLKLNQNNVEVGDIYLGESSMLGTGVEPFKITRVDENGFSYSGPHSAGGVSFEHSQGAVLVKKDGKLELLVNPTYKDRFNLEGTLKEPKDGYIDTPFLPVRQ